MRDRSAVDVWRLWVLLAVIMSTSPASADGQDLFKRQCSACHSISPHEPVRQGPPLSGVFGKKAGSVEGFKYSKALSESDFVWDEANLDAWLTNPQKLVKGTFMSYRQSKPDVRHEIIEYIKEIK